MGETGPTLHSDHHDTRVLRLKGDGGFGLELGWHPVLLKARPVKNR